MRPAVVVDTGVFSALLRVPPGALADRYASVLTAAAIYVAIQTVAELRYGAMVRGWEQPRLDEFERALTAATVLPVDDNVVWAHARLRLECRRRGHALHQPVHGADLWIAASAVAYELPLVSDDAVFVDAPGLDLVREPV